MSKPQKAYKYTNEELELMESVLTTREQFPWGEITASLLAKVRADLAHRKEIATRRAKHPRSPLDPAKVELAKKLLADTKERLTLREVAKQTGISYGRVWLISKGKLG